MNSLAIIRVIGWVLNSKPCLQGGKCFRQCTSRYIPCLHIGPIASSTQSIFTVQHGNVIQQQRLGVLNSFSQNSTPILSDSQYRLGFKPCHPTFGSCQPYFLSGVLPRTPQSPLLLTRTCQDGLALNVYIVNAQYAAKPKLHFSLNGLGEDPRRSCQEDEHEH
jgi:hypothetical protein